MAFEAESQDASARTNRREIFGNLNHDPLVVKPLLLVDR